MELRHLRYFLAVADAAHFTRAAQKLWVSQPTLSQQIKQLEEELGAPLFHRGAGGVQLTAAGEKFRPYAERVLHEMEEAVAALGHDEAAPGESLHIGALQGVADYLLPAVVARAVVESKLEIRVSTFDAETLSQMVARGELDLAISALGDSSHGEPLFDEDLVLWTPPAHRLSGKARARFGDLDDVPLFCVGAPSPLREILDDAAERAGIELRAVGEFGSLSAASAAAQMANLPAILPAPMLRSLSNAQGWSAVALTNPRPHRTIALLRPKSRKENPASRVLVAHLNAVVGELLKPECALIQFVENVNLEPTRRCRSFQSG